MTPRSLLFPAMSIAGSGLTFASSTDAGIIAGTIAGIGGVAIGLYGYFMERRVKAFKEIEAARLEIEVEREAKLGPSITRKLEVITVLLEQQRGETAEAKEEARSAREETREAKEENRELTNRILELMRHSEERMVRHTDANREHLDMLAKAEAATLEATSKTHNLVVDTAEKVETLKQAVERGASGDSIPVLKV